MDKNLNKLKEENENQYLWRIGNLIQDGYYQNWSQVLDSVNRALYGDDAVQYKGESAYRKRYAAAKQFYRDVFTKISSSEQCDGIQKQIGDLQAERYKLSAEKVELNRIKRQDARFDLFYEKIGKELNKFPPPSELVQGCSLVGTSEKEYMLTIADIHYGSDFVTETNLYNIEECHRRFNILLEYVRAFIWEHNLSKLNILNLGDEIQGLLRLSDLQLNETSVVKSVVGVSRLIAGFLYELSKECAIEYYSVPRSNHNQNRPLGTKASELAAEDVTYIIDHYIADVLSDNPHVKIHMSADRPYIEIPIFDYNIIAHHGNGIKNIDDYLKDISSYKRVFVDYAFLGHYHSGKNLSGNSASAYDTEVFVCPSIVGNDPYAESLMKSSKSACMIYGFDKTQGMNETHKIILN